jgi:phage-related protein
MKKLILLIAYGYLISGCTEYMDNMIVIGHGFQKKSQKTPRNEIERAEKIKREYYESKE